MLSPGGFYLLIGFVIPLIIIVILSLSSGGGLFSTGGKTTFSWNWSNYSDAVSDYWQIYLRSIAYAAIATTICIGLAYPMAYWIAFYGGRWKAPVVPADPGAVLRVVRDPHRRSGSSSWATNGMLSGRCGILGWSRRASTCLRRRSP